MLTRRQSLLAATAMAMIGLAGADPARAEDKTIKIGVDLSLTGAAYAAYFLSYFREYSGSGLGGEARLGLRAAKTA